MESIENIEAFELLIKTLSTKISNSEIKIQEIENEINEMEKLINEKKSSIISVVENSMLSDVLDNNKIIEDLYSKFTSIKFTEETADNYSGYILYDNKKVPLEISKKNIHNEDQYDKLWEILELNII